MYSDENESTHTTTLSIDLAADMICLDDVESKLYHKTPPALASLFTHDQETGTAYDFNSANYPKLAHVYSRLHALLLHAWSPNDHGVTVDLFLCGVCSIASAAHLVIGTKSTLTGACEHCIR